MWPINENNVDLCNTVPPSFGCCSLSSISARTFRNQVIIIKRAMALVSAELAVAYLIAHWKTGCFTRQWYFDDVISGVFFSFAGRQIDCKVCCTD